MSLWARRLGLVALPALLLLGCERDDLTIGLPPKDNIFELGYFEYSLNVLQTQEDSIVNLGTGRLLLGAYDDPYLGQLSTTGYSTIDAGQLAPPNADVGAVADSMVITLRADYINGGSNIFMDYNIWELNFTLNDQELYKSDREQPLLSMAPIGQLVGNFPMSTFLNDSLVTVKGYFDLDFANRVLDSLELTNDLFEFGDEFKSIFAGVAFEPAASADGIIGFDLDNTETTIVLYYTDANGDKESWPMKFNQVEHYNYVSVNGTDFSRPGTSLEALTQTHTDFDPPGNYIYYQGGTGLGIVAETDPLLVLADTLSNTVIQTAIIEIEDIEVPDDRVVPQIIRILLTDDSNRPLFYNGNILRTIYQGSRSDTVDLSSQAFRNGALEELLKYDSARNSYTADITLFMQAYLEGRRDLTKLWFYDPRVVTNVSSWRTLKDKAKIKIYYTRPKN